MLASKVLTHQNKIQTHKKNCKTLNNPTQDKTEMKLVNMVLTMGGETLTGEFLPLPENSNKNRRPLTPTARSWLQGCALAQRQIFTAGASGLFDQNTLRIDVPGALGRDEAALLSSGLASLFSVKSFAGATYYQSLLAPFIKKNSKKNENPEPYAGIAAKNMTIPEGSRFVSLPTASKIFDFNIGLANSAPFWDAPTLANYVCVHEAGHCVHLSSPIASNDRCLAKSAGLANLIPLMTNLGYFDKKHNLQRDTNASNGDISNIYFLQLGECYADCFAALCMGSGNIDKVLVRAMEISKMREACIPENLGDYSTGDYEHDTREALEVLVAELGKSEAMLPADPESIHALCAKCALIGSLRWVQHCTIQPAGPVAWLLWSRGADLFKNGQNAKEARLLSDLYDQSIQALSLKPFFTELSGHMTSTPTLEASKHSLCFVLQTLGATHEACGDSLIDLRGSKLQTQSLSSKVSSWREHKSQSPDSAHSVQKFQKKPILPEPK